MRSNGSTSISVFNTYSNRAISDLNALGKRLDTIIGILMKLETAKIQAKKENKKEIKKENKTTKTKRGKTTVTESEDIDDFDEPIILNY